MKSRVIVFALAFLGCGFSLTAQRLGMDPQQSPFSKLNSSRTENNTISGTVSDIRNQPLKDVQVELRDSGGGVVTSAYTSSSGNFEFSQIASGTYLVVATSGMQQASERVDTTGWSNMVSLRMPSSAPQDGMTGNSISVVQYRIPGKARDEYNKAHDLLQRGKQEEATKHLAKALELCPNYADALTLRGVLELNQRNTEAAVTDLDKAIHADANYAMAYMVMGSALNQQSKFDEAIRALERGESLAPTYWQVHFEMGKSYIGKADYPAALHQLELAENMTPSEYPFIYLLRGHALLAMKQYPQAMEAVQAYLQKDPQGVNSELARKMLQQAQALMAKN
ncbi:MAG TPA: tetratricopeptide repeat protein [Candidatus Angelobacter sp.]|jgi:Tfp pilus assembly protein PilF